MDRQPQSETNRRILIVDDEAEIRKGYRGFLNPELPASFKSSRSRAAVAAPEREEQVQRFEITEAESGDRALAILLEELKHGRRFAGAIVDVRMPGRLDGLQFIREAWQHDPTLLVVVATAYQDRSVDDIDRFFGETFQDQWDYLNKPFTSGEIVQKARQLVSSWNRRERERLYLKQIEGQQQTLLIQERLAAVGRLARSVGHEFGNVLQPLTTKLELAQERLAAGRTDGVTGMLEEMMEAVTIGSNICHDLLVFARETAESAKPSTIPLERPIQKALRLLRHDLKKKDIAVTASIPADLAVTCHEPRMVQVFVNLFANALHALKDGGKLEIDARPNGASILLEIRDNGAGIAPEDLPLLFQPLFSTKPQGNGLGLTVCKQVIEEYDGTIAIASEPGKGTTVSLGLKRG